MADAHPTKTLPKASRKKISTKVVSVNKDAISPEAVVVETTTKPQRKQKKVKDTPPVKEDIVVEKDIDDDEDAIDNNNEEKEQEPEDDEDVVNVGIDIDEDEEEEEDEEEDDRKNDDEQGDQEDVGDDEQVKPKTVKKKVNAKKAATVVADAEVIDEDEDEGELMDEDYIQRVHPEVIFPDTKELESILSSYADKENPVIRRSRPILSKYEATSIIGMRAQQIVHGATPLIDTQLENPIEIAIAELKAKIIPVIVRRIMGDGISEYWRLGELTYYG